MINIHAVMTKSPILILLSIGVVSALTSVGGLASPAETASPAISEKFSSVEPRAGINDSGHSSPAVIVNTKSFDPAAATKAWLATVPQEKRQKSDRYFEGGYWLLLWNFLVAAAISIFLLLSKISARLRDLSERLARSKTLQVACYSVPYLLLVYVLSFP